MAQSSYTCPGCRQALIAASPDGEEILQTCPVRECRRTIWLRSGPNAGLQLLTDTVPDLSVGRFVMDGFRLLDGGVELLTGPAEVLEALARLLNNIPDLTDAELIKLVRAHIQAHGAGCIFTPGYALVKAGRAAMESETA